LVNSKSETNPNFDDLSKTPSICFSVIPVKTGIQFFECLSYILDSRLRGNDDFLRIHQIGNSEFSKCIRFFEF